MKDRSDTLVKLARKIRHLPLTDYEIEVLLSLSAEYDHLKENAQPALRKRSGRFTEGNDMMSREKRPAQKASLGTRG